MNQHRYAFATAPRKATYHWDQHEPALTWPEFVDYLDLEHPASSKDCGGYVAVELEPTTGHAGKVDCVGLHRNRRGVAARHMVTLDADKASSSFALDVELELSGVAAVLHTTWSHTAEAPRWRVVIPLSGPVKNDDYTLIAKALMTELGWEQFDTGSSEPERYMNLPSSQGVYDYRVLDGEPLDVDAWLERADQLGIHKQEAPASATYVGTAAYDELSYDQQQSADLYLDREVDRWRKVWEDAADWAVGVRDDKNRGWDELAKDTAWSMARLAVCPWVALDEDGAEALYLELVPAEVRAELSSDKWFQGLAAKADAAGAADAPPWEHDDFDIWVDTPPMAERRGLLPCDHSNEAVVSRWLLHQVGTGPLTGLFRRGEDDLIYTPRVGEAGYEPPVNPSDADGPAQVRRMNALRLASKVDGSYNVFKMSKATKSVPAAPIPCVFRRDLAERVLADLDRCTNLQRVNMVTHTPVMRADGTVLDAPGFDKDSGVLYLPERGLHVPQVPEVPTDGEVAAARSLLLDDLLVDFPFVTEHDRANYLGCLMLPLIRLVVPPPYQMLIIGAPQAGSGKSMLAEIMRTLHGGVFRSEIPKEEDERRKVITSILDGTSAPVVQFDNVNGVLKSSTMDGLLTNAVWSDRRLGVNENVIVPNDRLWVVTGNNVQIGGDLHRRVLWATINADTENPEKRPNSMFKHRLPAFAVDHRGELLHALLVLIRAWAVAGFPVTEAPTSDSFGRAQQVLRGVFRATGIPGDVGHTASQPERPDLEAEEWTTFLRAAERVKGDAPWTVRELFDTVSEFSDDEASALSVAELPGDLADRYRHNPHSVAKALGKLLSKRQSQWIGGLKVESAGGGGKHAVRWRVEGRV